VAPAFSASCEGLTRRLQQQARPRLRLTYVGHRALSHTLEVDITISQQLGYGACVTIFHKFVKVDATFEIESRRQADDLFGLTVNLDG